MLAMLLASQKAFALQLDPVPGALRTLILPRSPDQKVDGKPIIVDPKLAVVLGKAVFWDMQIGDGGTTCATCHHHAGVDSRLKGQITRANPARELDPKHNVRPSVSDSPNCSQPITSDLFPFIRAANDAEMNARPNPIVMGSAGIFRSSYSEELKVCRHSSDFRQITLRNAPSVINARFNQRLFWDGRARATFNGLDSLGFRSHAKGKTIEGGLPHSMILEGFPDAPLVSQAISLLVTSGEMVCDGETLVDIARRLLPMKVLSRQSVHSQDSVLGKYRAPNGYGLILTYRELIQRVFSKRLWQAPQFHRDMRRGGKASDSRMAANFGIMLGLALMAYEETLVSDDAPFDRTRDTTGYPSGFTPEQRRGLDLFNRLECDFCHMGPVFTAAAKLLPAERRAEKWLDRRVIAPDLAHHDAQVAFLDVGFANIGVTPSEEDPGVGGTDSKGFPLSYAEQYIRTLKEPETQMTDRVKVDPKAFSIGFDVDFKPSELVQDANGTKSSARVMRPDPKIVIEEGNLAPKKRLGAAVRGAFKIPSLRNVELTGPYMHNGSMKSLEEVIDFYDRGGNFPNPEKIQTFIHPQHLSEQEKQDLRAFLLTLTDDRVRWERSPFDHPSLRIPIPSGQEGNQNATEQWLEIPAVGRYGRPPVQGPLRSFEARITSNDIIFNKVIQ